MSTSPTIYDRNGFGKTSHWLGLDPIYGKAFEGSMFLTTLLASFFYRKFFGRSLEEEENDNDNDKDKELGRGQKPNKDDRNKSRDGSNACIPMDFSPFQPRKEEETADNTNTTCNSEENQSSTSLKLPIQIQPTTKVTVLAPGLVLLESAISLQTQCDIAKTIFHYGHTKKRNGFWLQPARNRDDPDGFCPPMELNNKRQGRGRIYDKLSSFFSARYLNLFCKDITELAMSHDEELPSIDPTHLLVMYYTTSRNLGWHSDNGKQDGVSLEPVVSLSIGNTCDFQYKFGKTDTPKSVILKSGDVLIFGGPARHVLHSVSSIEMDTCPRELLEIQSQSIADHCPNKDYAPPASFRLNLTYRNAPELLGTEESDKFFYFAASARRFEELKGKVGVEEARALSNSRREEKKKRKKAEKERLENEKDLII